MRPETKYFDTAVDEHSVAVGADWAGTEVPCDFYILDDGVTVGAYTDAALIPSASGTGYGEIAGNRYQLKKIRVRGQMTVTTATAAATVKGAVNARVALVMDTDPKGTQLQGEKVFSDLGAAGVCNYSFRQMGQVTQSFEILKDVRFSLMPTVASNNASASTISTGYQQMQFDFSYTFKVPRQVHVLEGTDPDIQQLSDCNIFLLAHADTASTISCAARAYYVG